MEAHNNKNTDTDNDADSAEENQEAYKPEAAANNANGIWEGDPGDGTDFITVVDIPIEDQTAIPLVDISTDQSIQQILRQHRKLLT